MYLHRTYRKFDENQRLIPFQVTVKETDLYIKARSRLEKEAEALVRLFRKELEGYIATHPAFLRSFVPLPDDKNASPLIREMLIASSRADVGPMAAVAGAVAEFVGKSLLEYSSEVIVENGGDIFACVSENLTVEIFAGKSPLSGKIGIRLDPSHMPAGICTSSGTVGPSVSFGKADAVTVVSPSTAFADAVATCIGNMIRTEDDIQLGLKRGETFSEVKGVVIIAGEKMGVYGDLELVKL